MSSISVLLLAVHDTVHDSRMKLNYSEPKIYTGGVDPKKWSKLSKADQNMALSRQWYVYFSFRDPSTGLLKRQPNIKGGANTFSTKRDRFEFLKVLQRNLQILLQAGFDPYKNNSELTEKFMDSKDNYDTIDQNDKIVVEVTKPILKDNKIEKGVTKAPLRNIEAISNATKTIEGSPTKPELPQQLGATIKEAFALGMKIKKNTLNENSYPKYKSRINRFQKWLEENQITHINMVDKRTVVNYLNSVVERTSARNRNNDRTTLSSLFTTLEHNEIIKDNFILKINVLKTNPERNKTFTPKQVEEMNDYMDEYDPLMKLFTQFVSFNFLRPIEVCRLKIKDVDILDRKLYVRAKNKAVKIKIIPEILLKKLPDLSKMNDEHYLFTPNNIGDTWNIGETDKRNYFSKRFKKVKDHFKMNKDYGLYSYRHTFITNIYREMAKTATPLEVKSKLMVITGHTTEIALAKYLRDIDAVLPEDYSHLLKEN